jgi:carbon-monoxide dehydrogenase small subunit
LTTTEIRLHINGEATTVHAPPLRRLLDVLRDDLGLKGTKEGCGEGECGACTVLIDGEPINSCLVPACQARGTSVTTIEGVRHESLLDAFVVEGATQCGICTPGMILATRGWLDDCRRRGVTPDEPSARQALAGNLCRCTGYGMIVAAVLRAANEEA